MAYLRQKTVKGRVYYYVVASYRNSRGLPRQKSLLYLGSKGDLGDLGSMHQAIVRLQTIGADAARRLRLFQIAQRMFPVRPTPGHPAIFSRAAKDLLVNAHDRLERLGALGLLPDDVLQSLHSEPNWRRQLPP